eukprot:365219-Chlamydomonas_euryale.AAC.13
MRGGCDAEQVDRTIHHRLFSQSCTQLCYRIQVSSTKHPMFFYVNLAKKLLSEHGEVQLSALGQGDLQSGGVARIERTVVIADRPRTPADMDG